MSQLLFAFDVCRVFCGFDVVFAMQRKVFGVPKLFGVPKPTTVRGPDILRNVIVLGYVTFYRINRFFAKVLFFHYWQNVFAGRSLETLHYCNGQATIDISSSTKLTLLLLCLAACLKHIRLRALDTWRHAPNGSLLRCYLFLQPQYTLGTQSLFRSHTQEADDAIPSRNSCNPPPLCVPGDHGTRTIRWLQSSFLHPCLPGPPTLCGRNISMINVCTLTNINTKIIEGK